MKRKAPQHEFKMGAEPFALVPERGLDGERVEREKVKRASDVRESEIKQTEIQL